jgi:hypothetical protein
MKPLVLSAFAMLSLTILAAVSCSGPLPTGKASPDETVGTVSQALTGPPGYNLAGFTIPGGASAGAGTAIGVGPASPWVTGVGLPPTTWALAGPAPRTWVPEGSVIANLTRIAVPPEVPFQYSGQIFPATWSDGVVIGAPWRIVNGTLQTAAFLLGALGQPTFTSWTSYLLGGPGNFNVLSGGPGCVTDIAVGSNAQVWAIGCDAQPTGYSVWSYSGASGTWSKANGGIAMRVAVSPEGTPWTINAPSGIASFLSSGGHISKYVGGSWSSPDSGNALGTSIGAGPNGVVWIVGLNKGAWMLAPGTASFVNVWNGNYTLGTVPLQEIAVGSDGTPWALATSQYTAQPNAVLRWSGQWGALGPAGFTSPPPPAKPLDTFSADVEDIDVSNYANGQVVVGTAGGGVFSYSTQTHQWTPLGDPNFGSGPSQAVGSLALNPANPNIIMVATGIYQGNRGAAQQGNGIWQGTSNGTSWSWTPSLCLNCTFPPYFHKIRYVPGKPGTIFAASMFGLNGGGLFISTTGGSSFYQPTQALNGFAIANGLSDLVVDSSGTVYMAEDDGSIESLTNFNPQNGSGTFNRTPGGTFLSPQGGSWIYALPLQGSVNLTPSANIVFTQNQTLAGGSTIYFASQPATPYTLAKDVSNTTNGTLTMPYTGGMTTTTTTLSEPSGLYYTQLAIAPPPSTAMYGIFLGDFSFRDASYGVWKTTNRTVAQPTWTQTNLTQTCGTFLGAQDGHNEAIAVSPYNANLIVAGAVGPWWSTDGGGTAASPCGTDWQAGGDAKDANGVLLDQYHEDLHAIAFAPDGTVFMATDGGVMMSSRLFTDRKTQTWSTQYNTIPATQERAVSVDTTTSTDFPHILAAAWDVGLHQSTGGIKYWTGQNNDSFEVHIDAANPSAEWFGGAYSTFPYGVESGDEGASWPNFNAPDGLPQSASYQNSIVDMAVDRGAQVYAAGDSSWAGVWLFDDGTGPHPAHYGTTAWVSPSGIPGTVTVTAKSTAVTFSQNQTLGQGTVIVFASQPGVQYSLNAINGVQAGTLTNIYTGPQNAVTSASFPAPPTTVTAFATGGNPVVIASGFTPDSATLNVEATNTLGTSYLEIGAQLPTSGTAGSVGNSSYGLSCTSQGCPVCPATGCNAGRVIAVKRDTAGGAIYVLTRIGRVFADSIQDLQNAINTDSQPRWVELTGNLPPQIGADLNSVYNDIVIDSTRGTIFVGSTQGAFKATNSCLSTVLANRNLRCWPTLWQTWGDGFSLSPAQVQPYALGSCTSPPTAGCFTSAVNVAGHPTAALDVEAFDAQPATLEEGGGFWIYAATWARGIWARDATAGDP